MDIKATLSSGKVVVLREMKVKHTELAAQEVSPKCNGDSILMALLMQKALLKLLIISLNGKAMSANELEMIDDHFSLGEYNQLLGVVKQMAGGDDVGKSPTIELVTSGDK